MLRHNNGIWTPPDYHFRLPSGAHGKCFVRVADAIRTPRDGLALASWVAPFVQEATGILLDSASLVGLTAAIDAMAARAGCELGPVVSLEEYPKNRLDTMKAVRDVDRGSNVIALLSVHSTGSLLSRLLSALEQVASKEWTLQILVDKASDLGWEELIRPGADANSLERTTIWTHLGETADVAAEDCRSCRQGPARIAQIDPRTFDGMVLPTPELLTPSAVWAFDQREFWELVDSADAVTLDTASDVSNMHPRYGTDKFMSVKVSFAELLASPHRTQLERAVRDRIAREIREEQMHSTYDLVVVDEREADHDGFDELLSGVREELEISDVVVFPSESVEDNQQQQIIDAERILLLRLGLVSGLSLQQALYEIQQLRRGTGPYSMDALVVHLRPQDGRVRETLQNSLARRLVSVWDSFLPEDRHPLEEEQEIISAIREELPEHAASFLDERLAICSGFPTDAQLLWGAGSHSGDDATRISPMSYFGEALRVRAAYAAIGAAVHHARVHADAPRSAPHWRMFEMPAIFRSYYDPVILCCILRWLRSTEVWWGVDDRTADSALTNVLRRTRGPELPMLVAELLLAASQAKVPSALSKLLMTEGQAVAEGIGAPNNAPIVLGMAALRHGLD
jgi:hypothetical protein